MFFSSSIHAQTLNQVKDLADLYFKQEKYHEAIDNYLEIQKERPKDTDIKYKLGLSYYHIGNALNAEKYLLHVAYAKDSKNDAWFYLGKVFQKKGSYKEAIDFYKKYLEIMYNKNSIFKNHAEHFIKQCDKGMKLNYQEDLAIVDNLGGEINGIFDDYAPVISKGRDNTIYFSSVRANNAGGLRDKEGLQDEILGTYNSDIYSTHLVNGVWGNVRPLDYLINSSRNDRVIGFNDAANVLYYYKGYHATRDGAIFTDTIRASEMVVIPKEFLCPVKYKEGHQTPFFFHDSIIIYAANLEDSFGGLDLYITKRIAGNFWTRPQNLGPEINSPYDEKSPYLANDGRTLYFSSDQINSLGGFDIFVANFNDDNLKWSEPQNLGAPINSPGDDLDFCLTNDGLKGFFSSNRFGSIGGFDIYTAYFKSARNEQLVTSQPICFNLVTKESNSISTPINNSPNNTIVLPPDMNPQTPEKTEEVAITIHIKPLFYNTDEDILSSSNIKEISKALNILNQYSNTKIEVGGFSDDSDPEKFRLYFSYLRAQKVADYFIRNKISRDRIIIKGLGDSYPIALNSSSNGKRLNKRIELRVLYNNPDELIVKSDFPTIDEDIQSNERSYYAASLDGLSYKVQISALKTMYEGDAIINYPSPMVEKDNNRGFLRYTLGLFKSYSLAKEMSQNLRTDGIDGAYVVPYIDGIRLDANSAQYFVEQYPDLQNFINGK